MASKLMLLHRDIHVFIPEKMVLDFLTAELKEHIPEGYRLSIDYIECESGGYDAALNFEPIPKPRKKKAVKKNGK